MTDTVGSSLVNGEAPVSIQSDVLSARVGADDGCALQGQSFSGAATAAYGAPSFELPKEQLCDGSSGGNMQVSATSFTTNTYTASASETTGTQVESFKIKDASSGGSRRRRLTEKKIANLTSPIIMSFPMLVQAAPAVTAVW
eukprot:326009-Prymnesium_polylepis.1